MTQFKKYQLQAENMVLSTSKYDASLENQETDGPNAGNGGEIEL